MKKLASIFTRISESVICAIFACILFTNPAHASEIYRTPDGVTCYTHTYYYDEATDTMYDVYPVVNCPSVEAPNPHFDPDLWDVSYCVEFFYDSGGGTYSVTVLCHYLPFAPSFNVSHPLKPLNFPLIPALPEILSSPTNSRKERLPRSNPTQEFLREAGSLFEFPIPRIGKESDQLASE